MVLPFKCTIFETHINPILLQKNFTISYLLLAAILLVISSCNSTKYVPQGDYLLRKNKVVIDDKTKLDSEVKDYIIQRPNSRFLGYPFSLHFYNLGNENYEQRHSEWVQNHPKTNQTLRDIFSEKQTVKMGETYKSINKWFLNGGEPPVVLDEEKAKITSKKLRTFYFNKGYFNAEVDHSVVLKVKKAEIHYNITKNEPYRLDSIYTVIDSKTIDSIYHKTIENSFIKSGDIYDDSNFRKEAKRLTNVFRNSGIYHFSENQIGFYDIDTTAVDLKTDVILKITDRLTEKEGVVTSHPLKQQRVSKIGIFTDYSYARKDDLFKDTVYHKGFTFYSHDKLKYRPNSLLNAIFIEPGNIYKDSTTNLTRRHLRLLKNFKLVKIKYEEINDEELAASIVLTPLKKYSIGLNTEVIHSNIKQLGFSGGFSFVNRNTFKNAEIFKLAFQGSIFDVAKNIGGDESAFSSWELSAEASLEVPRFMFPFNADKIIDKRMAPKTMFSVGSSFQKNIGLDKQKLTGIIDYSWTPSKKTKHTVELINAQYVKNLNKESYFYIYSSEYDELEAIQEEFFPTYPLTPENALDFIDENIDEDFQASNPEEYQIAKNVEKRHEILTTDVVIPSLSYAYTYSSQTDFKDTDYVFFRAKVASAGNIMTAITNTETAEGIKTFADIPIAQFVRTDFEFKKFWNLSKSSVLVYRNFIGIAFPYGNSTEIPFTSSYFIGGSSDIRAWKTYELGPGSNNTGLEFNVGSLKLIANLEYRFDITSSIKGALFVDAGNIWDITDSELTTEGEKFTSFASLKNSAIGSGFGIRYDFSFFVLRMDLGIKTYEPYLTGDRWFQNFELRSSVFNIGINYPF